MGQTGKGLSSDSPRERHTYPEGVLFGVTSVLKDVGLGDVERLVAVPPTVPFTPSL